MYVCKDGWMGVGGRLCDEGGWTFSKGCPCTGFSGGRWACSEPSVQQLINDRVRGRQGPGSRLANDYSGFGAGVGEVHESGRVKDQSMN